MVRPASAVLPTTAALVLLLTSWPASAHHLMGGQIPATLLHGFLSGVGHPIIGLDHFAFVIAVGLMSRLAGRAFLLPLVFVVATLAGCLAHIRGMDLPAPEVGVALTVAAGAAIVALHLEAPSGVFAALFAVAGLFHGYAYGESIVGAEPAPLAGYLLGFTVIQYGIALAGAEILGRIVAKRHLAELTVWRATGAAIALIGAMAFASAIFAA